MLCSLLQYPCIENCTRVAVSTGSIGSWEDEEEGGGGGGLQRPVSHSYAWHPESRGQGHASQHTTKLLPTITAHMYHTHCTKST